MAFESPLPEPDKGAADNLRNPDRSELFRVNGTIEAVGVGIGFLYTLLVNNVPVELDVVESGSGLGGSDPILFQWTNRREFGIRSHDFFESKHRPGRDFSAPARYAQSEPNP